MAEFSWGKLGVDLLDTGRGLESSLDTGRGLESSLDTGRGRGLEIHFV